MRSELCFNREVLGLSELILKCFYIVQGGSCKITGQALSMAFDPTGLTLWVGDDKGALSSFTVDLAHGKLTRTRRVSVCEGHAITSISARAWVSREAREPSLLVNCAVNSLCLFRYM